MSGTGPPHDVEPAPLSAEEIRDALVRLPSWRVSPDGVTLTRHFCFGEYRETIEFVLKAARVVQHLGHYPVMRIARLCVDLELTTPGPGCVTDHDVALATQLETCHFVHLATARTGPPPTSAGTGGGCCGPGGGCG